MKPTRYVFTFFFHLYQFWGRHGVDGPPRWSRAWLQRDLQVVLPVGREDVGLHLREDIQVVMVFLGNCGVEGGLRLEEGKKRRERRRRRREGGVGRGGGCEVVGEGWHGRSVEGVLLRRFLCLLRCRLSRNRGWFLCVSPGDKGGGGKGDGCVGRGKANSKAERGCKGEGTLTLVNTRVVAGQPRES